MSDSLSGEPTRRTRRVRESGIFSEKEQPITPDEWDTILTHRMFEENDKILLKKVKVAGSEGVPAEKFTVAELNPASRLAILQNKFAQTAELRHLSLAALPYAGTWLGAGNERKPKQKIKLIRVKETANQSDIPLTDGPL